MFNFQCLTGILYIFWSQKSGLCSYSTECSSSKMKKRIGFYQPTDSKECWTSEKKVSCTIAYVLQNSNVLYL